MKDGEKSMAYLTFKQKQWYQSCLAAFAQPGNRYNGKPSLVYCATRLGIPMEQVIEDAHAAGVTDRDGDIKSGMEWAAKEIGARPTTGYAPRRREARQTFPDFVRNLIRDGGGVADFDELRRLSPIPVSGMSPQTQTAAFLAALYRPTHLLHIFASDHHRRGEIGRDILTRDEWLERMKRTGELGGDCIGKNPITGRQGTSGKGTPSYTSRDCIAVYRFALVEFDHLPLLAQCAFWCGWLSDPKRASCLAALTFSGGKSIHGLVRTGADDVTAPTIEQGLRDLLCADTEARPATGKDGKPTIVYPYRTDRDTLRPHGGTRLAGAKRRPNGELQALLFLAPPSFIP